MNKEKKKFYNFIKPKLNRKFAVSTGAVALAAVVTATGLWQSVPTVPVYAKETFSGIRKVVESYDKDNPFVILDIVPGTATYSFPVYGIDETATPAPTIMPSPTGTPIVDLGVRYESEGTIDTEVPLAVLPYLTDGKTPAEEALIKAVEDNPSYFLSYYARSYFAGNLIPEDLYYSSFDIRYEERYGGVIGSEELTGENGWTKLYSNVDNIENVISQYQNASSLGPKQQIISELSAGLVFGEKIYRENNDTPE